MGKRGGTKHLKRISASKAIIVKRKEKTWIQRPLPGPHAISACAPLSHIMKEIGVAETMKEVKKILSSRLVYIDGKIVTEPKRAVGFMDVISVGDKSWRVLFDEKGRLIVNNTKNKAEKVCRIERKIRIQKGKIQFSLHDGRTISSNDGKVGDCLLISLPEGKIVKRYPLATKMNCLIIGGKHIGRNAVIEELVSGTATRIPQAKCNIAEVVSTTFRGYIFPIGDFKLE